MIKVYVINGPSINLTGSREPKFYGDTSYKDMVNILKKESIKKKIKVKVFQTNSEGLFIDLLQKANKKNISCVINPGAYSHYSYAIMDAIRSLSIPVIEVHLSDIFNREDFRKNLITGNACREIIAGKGINGYIEAIEKIAIK